MAQGVMLKDNKRACPMMNTPFYIINSQLITP